ncbi:phage tail protein [Malaciobacter canalis]|uniref:Phage tail protein n=1 Tax=Malaciobacter canalis TaxID=1912871 RepID=A0ABX4LQW5_9BACT|nr:contractile injection system protein, VgrG/Pvc8 family [Malaciobacter canalis]PHO10340.1 phage tail protein [Malaciobacter canalis]QEE32444.1 phage tail protein, gpD family [Malaciobacter canalis]
MVRTPGFMIQANGKDVTAAIQKNLISLSFHDEVNEKADELNIKVAGEFARPAYQDELKLYMGYDEQFTYMGSFLVQTTTRDKKHVLSISATGVNFTNALKEKRDITYEKVSIKDICKQIAARSGINLKSDFDDTFVSCQVQSNESDLHFLNRLAKEYNAIFNIKNNTLIFTKKIKDEKKNDDLPTYTINANNCDSYSIKYSNKTLYKSCKSTWHDTKENKTQSITVGSGEPVLINKGNFKNPAEAKGKAAAKLQRANQGLISGSLSIEGEAIFAGGKLNLVNTLEDDGEYQIKTVEHTFDQGGWMININFER